MLKYVIMNLREPSLRALQITPATSGLGLMPATGKTLKIINGTCFIFVELILLTAKISN